MATSTSVHHKPTRFSVATLLSPFLAVGRFMIMLAESSSQMRALNRLNEMSDAELSARGRNRSSEIRRIVGSI